MRYDVCVFGGCSMDQMYYLDNDGNILDEILIPGGKGSNQAVAASRAGSKVTIISKIGKDKIGDSILDNLIYNSVSVNNVEVLEGLENDCTKIFINSKDKDNEMIRFTGAINSFTEDMVEKYKKVLLNSKIVVSQLKAPKNVIVALINFCNSNNIPIVLTPCRPERLKISEDNNLDLINKLDYITCNKTECETIFESSNVEECVKKYPNKLIVTLGDKGVIYHDGEKVINVSQIKIDKIEDTTGAGDTFNGNLVSSLAEGYSLYDSVVRANYVSAYKCQYKTAQSGMPYKSELDEFIINCRLNK